MNDQLIKNIESIVDGIFKKKEEAEMRKETEAALTQAADTITQLTESLEAKDTDHAAEVSTLKETISSLEEQVNQMADSAKNFEDELACFDKEKEELVKRAEAAEEELETIKKDQIANERILSLQAAGVSSTNIDSQRLKVREMSEEEFASYTEELVSIKEAIIKELEANASSQQTSASTASDDAISTKEAEEAALAAMLESRLSELKDAGAEITDEAEIDKIKAMDDSSFASFKEEILASLDVGTQAAIDPMRAMAAALNMEVSPNEDMLSKYRALGAALAESINDRYKK